MSRTSSVILLPLALCLLVNGFVPTSVSSSRQMNVIDSCNSPFSTVCRENNRRTTTTIHPRTLQLSSTAQETISGTASSAATSSPLFPSSPKPMGKIKSTITKIGMMAYITAMCLALPIALFPPFAMLKLGIIDKVKQEQMSLRAGQFCARWLLKLIPFCRVETIPHHDSNPEPSIWVCNHTSALDIFILLATDWKLRGKTKRPIKIVYWKQLEENPITKLLFTQCGFIPVNMTANKAGEANDYDIQSFKNLLKQSKKAFSEGFDIGILPEGQLNPNPEEGLLPCFPGAFTLARMSRRPIHMMALHGTHRLWHAREEIGMTVTGRDIKVKAYPGGRKYSSGDEFLATFEAVVGEFATKGKDLHPDEVGGWLDGSKWQEVQQKEKEEGNES